MKRYITVIAALLTLSVAVFAQDARNRTTTTIVGDVLAAMPVEKPADLKVQMTDLAKAAPESVEMIAAMMQAPEKAVNNKYEYALNAVANFASDPANASYKANVLKGFQNAAAKMEDATAKQFLNAQIAYLTPEAQPAPVFGSDKLNSKVYSKLWDKASAKNVLKVLQKSSDAAVRAAALRTAESFADDAFYAQVASVYPKLSTDAKRQVINWFGAQGAKDQVGLVLSEIDAPGLLGKNAVEAAGMLGGKEAAAALIERIGGERSAEVVEALTRFNGDIRPQVAAALKSATGSSVEPLMKLASARRIYSVAPQIFDIANSGSQLADAAIENLAGVVRPFQADKVASMLDGAAEKNVPALQNAFKKAVSTLSVAEKYAKVSTITKAAKNPSRFYDVLASVGTDSAAKDLADAYAAGNVSALAALKTMNSYAAANTLLKAGQSGDESALQRFVTLVTENEKSADRVYSKLMQVLAATKDNKTKLAVVNGLAKSPTLDSFIKLGEFVNGSDKALAIAASNSARTVATTCVDDIDTKMLKSTLTKAADVLANSGDADDGYTVDAIKNFLATVQEASPIFTLPADEAAEGFEVLFDGTNLDKWQGNKEGYLPVNGTIYVTAQYGSEQNLYTVKEYKDFVLRFEFSFVRAGANNGIGVRTPKGVDAAYEGMCEVQILDHDDPIYADWLQEYQVHGSVYGVVPAKRIKHKPLGEWSTEEIRVQGDRVKVTVNGEVILDANVREACKGHNVAPKGASVNEYTRDHKNHPGMFNKTGYIGLLGHGAGVKFRNIRVKEL